MRSNRLLLIAMLASAGPLAAQRGAALEGEASAVQPPRGGGRNAMMGRMMEERLVRQRLAQRAREVVGLNDDQMTKLAAMDRELTPQRVQLVQDEMRTRQALRRAMADSTVDQTKIGDYTSKLVDLQRRRTDLLDAEQKQLGTFMTPLQRAKYLALEEQVRRLVSQRLMNRGRAGPPPAGRR